MCFHNSLTASSITLKNRYMITNSEPEVDSFEPSEEINAFDHSLSPIVAEGNCLRAMHWGMIPEWVYSEIRARELKKQTLNAMAETALSKPSFISAIQHKRCLIPSTGFYEWQTKGKEKRKYKIQMKNSEIFSIAGMFDCWKNPITNTVWWGFSVLTCPANPLMAEIHNTKKRMPVLLLPEHESLWLNHESEAWKSLMKPISDTHIEAIPLSHFIDVVQGSLFD